MKKVNKYKNEIFELKDQLDSLTTKYVKVCQDKDRYK